MSLHFIILLICGYLLGSIPSAMIVSKLLGLPDPSKEGSKNPGATNVLRLGGKKAAILVLIADLLKGVLAIWLAELTNLHHMALGLVGVATILGHIFPIFNSFKGGKGVATAAGVLLALSWPLGVALIIIWLLTAFITRYSSLAALVAAVAAPILALFLTRPSYQIPILIISIILIARHYANIIRLMDGTENKIKL